MSQIGPEQKDVFRETSPPLIRIAKHYFLSIDFVCYRGEKQQNSSHFFPPHSSSSSLFVDLYVTWNGLDVATASPRKRRKRGFRLFSPLCLEDEIFVLYETLPSKEEASVKSLLEYG